MKYLLFLILLMTGIFAAAQQKAPELLTVMSYNIHHANPPSKPGLIDLDAIASVIRSKNPDVVALQEVDVNTKRSGQLNQAAEIARKLGMNYVFGKAIDYEGGEYGVAILSKYPISDTFIHKLPADSQSKGEPRILLTGKLSLAKGRQIRFGSTHLDSGSDPVNRNMQISAINRIAHKETEAFILAGDLNADPGTEAIHILDRQFIRTCKPCAPTFPEVSPQKAIDFIAVNFGTPFRVISHQVLNEQYASDHRPVLAVFELQ